MYVEVIRTVEAQQEHLRALDRKASFLLTAATVVIGLQSLPVLTGTLTDFYSVALAPASIMYILFLNAVFEAYRIREYSSSAMDLKEMQTYYGDSPNFTKRQFIASLRHAYESNRPIIDEKVEYLQRSEILLRRQVILVILAGVVNYPWDTIASWAASVYNCIS